MDVTVLRILRATGMRDGSHWRPSADPSQPDMIASEWILLQELLSSELSIVRGLPIQLKTRPTLGYYNVFFRKKNIHG